MTARPASPSRHPRGFTLVELVIVMVIMGVLFATIVFFMRPAVDAWFAVHNRSDLTDQAVTALETMQRDVRLAVPNSIRTPGSNCFELVPTSGGGRFRIDTDTVTAGSLPLDLQTATTQFDVLSSLSAPVGSSLVIDNQNPGDVYAASPPNRATVAATATPAASAGAVRVTISSAFNDPGYQNGRVLVVPSTGPVFYACSGTGVNASGDGTGTLYRYTSYGYNAAYPSSCGQPTGSGAAVLATKVKSCRFIYDPNQGATQQSGFVSMQLELSRNNEVISLLMGAHVSNVP